MDKNDGFWTNDDYNKWFARNFMGVSDMKNDDFTVKTNVEMTFTKEINVENDEKKDSGRYKFEENGPISANKIRGLRAKCSIFDELLSENDGGIVPKTGDIVRFKDELWAEVSDHGPIFYGTILSNEGAITYDEDDDEPYILPVLADDGEVHLVDINDLSYISSSKNANVFIKCLTDIIKKEAENDRKNVEIGDKVTIKYGEKCKTGYIIEVFEIRKDETGKKLPYSYRMLTKIRSLNGDESIGTCLVSEDDIISVDEKKAIDFSAISEALNAEKEDKNGK